MGVGGMEIGHWYLHNDTWQSSGRRSSKPVLAIFLHENLLLQSPTISEVLMDDKQTPQNFVIYCHPPLKWTCFVGLSFLCKGHDNFRIIDLWGNSCEMCLWSAFFYEVVCMESAKNLSPLCIVDNDNDCSCTFNAWNFIHTHRPSVMIAWHIILIVNQCCPQSQPAMSLGAEIFQSPPPYFSKRKLVTSTSIQH